jgi:hypothetical protein
MSPDEKLRLTHIAEAAALIADYLKGVSKAAFLNDRMRQDAVIRRIQINDRRDGKRPPKKCRQIRVNPSASEFQIKPNGVFGKRCPNRISFDEKPRQDPVSARSLFPGIVFRGVAYNGLHAF